MAPWPRRFSQWMMCHLLWDSTVPRQPGFWGWLRPKWKLWAAIAGSALLTWIEWVKHHPPEIALIAILHFLFVWIAIAIVAAVARRFGGRDAERG